MKIAVCLKRVPDTTAKIVIGADRTSIDEAGIKFIPNPYDEFALEAALALKEKAGAGEQHHRDYHFYEHEALPAATICGRLDVVRKCFTSSRAGGLSCARLATDGSRGSRRSC